MTIGGTTCGLSAPYLAPLVDFLATDKRPTAVLQLQGSRSPQLLYSNPALEHIFDPPSRDDFTAWARTLPSIDEEGGVKRCFKYAGRQWHYSLFQNHNCAVVYTQPEEIGEKLNDQAEDLSAATPKANNYDVFEPYSWVTDWTRFPCAAINSWTKFLRTVAWEKTPVGPMEGWSYELRELLVMTMACGDARVLAWGPDEIMFFNEAALPVVTPAAKPLLGFPIADMTGVESQLANKRFIQKALATGTPVKMRRTKYVYHRHGTEEDVFCDFNLLPLTSKTGHYNGIQIEFTEVTSEVLEGLRNDIVSALLECVAASDNLELLWSGLQKVFEASQAYLPYSMIYVSEDNDDDLRPSVDKEHAFRLRAATGVAVDAFPGSVKIHSTSDDSPLAQVFNQSLSSDEVTILKLNDGTLHPELNIKRPDGTSVKAVYILPIKARGERSPLGFILLGKDPNQPFSAEDIKMMEFIRETIWRSASIIALPEGQRNKDELVDTNHRLAQELRILMAEANESAFATLARDAPCGMYIINPDGTPRFLNQTFLDMTGFSSLEQVKEISRTRSYWSDIVYDEDSAPHSQSGDTVFARNFKEGIAQRSEHRLVYPRDPREPNAPCVFNRWVEAVSLPVFDPVFRIQGIMGFMLDISDRKKAEEVQEQNRALVARQQAQQLQDALANKAAADTFIDTISHELRNPLSAILQVADGATPTVESLLSNSSATESADAIFEAIKTIVLCAQHMKTIVDDILTLSKLDSSLLTLVPERSSPHDLALKALKIYESECLSANITTSLEIEDNYHGLSVDTVMMDSKRALQILMNLVSNAVKFTRSSTTREITLRLAASSLMPIDKPDGVMFASPDVATASKVSAAAVTSSEINTNPQGALYIQYTVIDTGRGVKREEIERLFQRFSQASSKTYAHYGGSGMGLFISKKLSELHGGQIGMKSDGLGLGSTFTFFIKVGRPAKQPVPSLPSTTPAVRLAKDKSATARSSDHSRTAAIARKMDILVVEDNIVNQTITAKQLRKLNHTVHVANNGEEALAFLRKTNIWQQTLSMPDSPVTTQAVPLSVVLMDVEMPIMDGLTCTRKIRELERSGSITTHLPIVVVTANARDEQIEKVLESGADSVITKPFRIPALVSAMADLVKDDD